MAATPMAMPRADSPARRRRVRNPTAEDGLVSFTFHGRTAELADVHGELVRAGVRVVWFRERETSLEEVFLRITKGEVV